MSEHPVGGVPLLAPILLGGVLWDADITRGEPRVQRLPLGDSIGYHGWLRKKMTADTNYFVDIFVLKNTRQQAAALEFCPFYSPALKFSQIHTLWCARMFAAFQQILCVDPGCTKAMIVFMTSAFVKDPINPSTNLLTSCHWVRKAAFSFCYQKKFKSLHFQVCLVYYQWRDALGHVCRSPWCAV